MGNQLQDYSEAWPRPSLPAKFNDQRPKLLFQQLEVDDYEGAPVPGIPNPYSSQTTAIVRLYGVTEKGNSVCAHVHGFLPYFYTPAPRGWQPGQHEEIFRKHLDVIQFRSLV